MQQTCFSCQSRYNLQENTPIVICEMNHVLCKKCVIQLSNTTQKCPTCQSPIMASTSNQQIPIQGNYQYGQVNQAYGPNQGYQYQGYGANQNWGAWNPPVGNQQIVQPVPYNPQGKIKNYIILLSLLAFIFFGIGIGLIVLLTKMQQCSFYSSPYECFIGNSRYCCYSPLNCNYSSVNSYCTPFSSYSSATIPVIFGIVFDFIIALTMLFAIIGLKIRQRRLQMGAVLGPYQRLN